MFVSMRLTFILSSASSSARVVFVLNILNRRFGLVPNGTLQAKSNTLEQLGAAAMTGIPARDNEHRRQLGATLDCSEIHDWGVAPRNRSVRAT